jgi:hypothetical protein
MVGMRFFDPVLTLNTAHDFFARFLNLKMCELYLPKEYVTLDNIGLHYSSVSRLIDQPFHNMLKDKT